MVCARLYFAPINYTISSLNHFAQSCLIVYSHACALFIIKCCYHCGKKTTRKFYRCLQKSTRIEGYRKLFTFKLNKISGLMRFINKLKLIEPDATHENIYSRYRLHCTIKLRELYIKLKEKLM